VEEDYCGEVFRIEFLMRELFEIAKKKTDNIYGAVNKFKMDLNKQKEYRELENVNFTKNIMFIKELSVHLPALTTASIEINDLVELEPMIFQNMINLECLSLYSSSIRSIDSKIFSCNKRLRTLNITCLINFHENLFEGLHSLHSLDIAENEITDLPPNLFKDLINLNYLNLALNQIKVIPDGLFRNLENLDDLNLHGNEINLLDQCVNIFQGLNKLKALNLSDNQIEQIPHGLFRNMNNLKAIDFEVNRIAYFPEGFFRDLINLKYLVIDENGVLSKSIPSNITICQNDFHEFV
jgi:Leucine-rich repeat (LRR) protein